jgi:O-antigen/teichoic acid export membrane protein
LYFLYGSPFAAAGTAMAILFVVQIVVVFLTLGTMCLLALDRPGAVFRGTVIGAVTTIALDFLLIPAYGIEGAALSLLLGTLFSAIAAYRSLAGLIRVAVEMRTILSIVGAAVIMAGAVAVYRFLVPLTTVFLTIGAVVMGMVVYTVFLLGIDRTIREEVRDLARGVGIPWIG